MKGIVAVRGTLFSREENQFEEAKSSMKDCVPCFILFFARFSDSLLDN